MACTQLCVGGGSNSKACKAEGEGSIPYMLYPDNDDKTVSPFLTYESKENPYVWPNMYDEMDDMFDACCLIYALAELRQKTRQGEIDDPSVLHLPLTALDVWKIVQINQQHLKDSKFGNSFYVELLEVLAKRQQKIVASTGNLISKRLQTQLVAFNDCNYQEEMVYGIAVNPTLQRITICFRGSISKMDWAMDEEIYMTSVDNPVPDSKIHAGSKLLVHNGFFRYLFAPLCQLRKEAEAKLKGTAASEVNSGATDTELSQYREMMQLHILPLLKQHPGYKIYVTGHSLGAALATLFAFFLSTEPDSVIPKPVTCISFGSPYVGNESFRLAHQTNESLGKLRNLRVSNYQDMVTLVPFISFRFKVWDSNSHVGSFFKHAGMNIRFFASATSSIPFQVIYPRIRTGFLASSLDELKRAWDYSLLANWSWDWAVIFAWKNHRVTEYQQRMDVNMPSLQNMYLNDLYANKAIVGHLVADF